MVKTDAEKLLEVFATGEEREFLLEMLEPEMHEGTETLQQHHQETLLDVDDIEAYTNMVGRQKRRLDFIGALYSCLEGSKPDD